VRRSDIGMAVTTLPTQVLIFYIVGNPGQQSGATPNYTNTLTN
jgi:hypothetical protein